MVDQSQTCSLRNKATRMKIQLRDGEQYDIFSCIATREECASQLTGDFKHWVFWKDALVAIHIDTLSTLDSVCDKVSFTWSYGEDEVDLRALKIKCDSPDEANDIIEKIASKAMQINDSNSSLIT